MQIYECNGQSYDAHEAERRLNALRARREEYIYEAPDDDFTTDENPELTDRERNGG